MEAHSLRGLINSCSADDMIQGKGILPKHMQSQLLSMTNFAELISDENCSYNFSLMTTVQYLAFADLHPRCHVFQY